MRLDSVRSSIKIGTMSSAKKGALKLLAAAILIVAGVLAKRVFHLLPLLFFLHLIALLFLVLGILELVYREKS